MRMISSLTAGALLAGALAFAQETGATNRGNWGPPDPATMIQHRVARLTSELGLSSAQQSQATQIFTAAQTAAAAARANNKSNQQALETAVKANDTASIDQLTTALGASYGQALAIESKANAAFYALLTSDQQNTFNSRPHGISGPGGPGMEGRPMPRTH